MSTNVVLIVVGVVLFLAGLAKMGNSQSGGFSLRNIGIGFGSTITQTNKVGNIARDAAKPAQPSKPDWVGLAIAAIGLLTALVGLLKG